MKRIGKDNLFIMGVTEHKCMSTLDNYVPVPDVDERIDGARGIMSVKQKKPKILVETVTTSQTTVKKTVSKTSIELNPNRRIDVPKAGQVDSSKTGSPKASGSKTGGTKAGGGTSRQHQIASEQGLVFFMSKVMEL